MKHLGFSVERIALAWLVASFPLIAAALAHNWRINPVGSIAELGGFAEPTVRDNPTTFWLLRRRRFERRWNSGQACLLHGLLELHQYCEILRVHGIRL